MSILHRRKKIDKRCKAREGVARVASSAPQRSDVSPEANARRAAAQGRVEYVDMTRAEFDAEIAEAVAKALAAVKPAKKKAAKRKRA